MSPPPLRRDELPNFFHALGFGNAFSARRYGHVPIDEITGDRLFLSAEEILACVHQKALMQTFVETETPKLEQMLDFKQRIQTERFGWKRWTAFGIQDDKKRAIRTFHWAFHRPQDAVHFRLVW